MKDLDISHVSKHAGIPASTLRYYEEKGLIKSIGRKGLKRLFNPDILERLALISLGQAAGFSLDEISMMFAPDGRPHIKKQMLLDKADTLNQKIKELTAMREGLLHAAKCSAPSHMECPSFQRILKAAMTGVIGKKKKRFS